MLHQHFYDPIADDFMDQLVHEIAGLLVEQEPDYVYSFYSRYMAENDEYGWKLYSCRLSTDGSGNNDAIIIFTYDLNLLTDNKVPLYQALEANQFLKNNFEKAASLTKKEKEICRLLTQGLNSKEIAASSFTSIHTVNTHRQHIKKKLGIQNLHGLLQFAAAFDVTEK